MVLGLLLLEKIRIRLELYTFKEELKNMRKTCAHLILDVGAGTHFTLIPRTINPRTSIRTGISVTEVNRPFIDVMSDAQYLPFRNNVF